MPGLFRKKQSAKEINRLLRGEAPDGSKNMILYIGNGADSVKTLGTVYRNLGGRHDICVETVARTGCAPRVKIVTFSNPYGTFQGYVLRRKIKGRWQWYGCDGAWHALRADMPEPKLFHAGNRLPLKKAEQPGTYILEARWLAPDGKYAGCGYPMFQNKLMAHALGGMDGKTYHNTKQAFDNARKNNYRYYETDLSLTSDNRLVVCHTWESRQHCEMIGMEYSPELEHATYEQIMAKTIHGNPVMDARELYELMKQYPECRFEIDFRGTPGKEMKNKLNLFLEDMHHDSEVLDRVLIQSYSKSMYEGMEGDYPFKYHQYLVGKNMHKVDAIIDYALDRGICALALRMNLAKPAIVQKIKKAGLYMLAYTVDSDLDVAAKLLQSGVDTLCTNFITPKMLEEPSDSFGHYPFYVYYHAGVAEAESGYPTAKRCRSGVYEYKDMQPWENDGMRALEKCRYTLPGRQFAGWNLRIKIENKLYWYGVDHMYHCAGDSTREVAHETFSDGQQLPVLTVKKNMRLVMVATWN